MGYSQPDAQKIYVLFAQSHFFSKKTLQNNSIKMWPIRLRQVDEKCKEFFFQSPVHLGTFPCLFFTLTLWHLPNLEMP